MGGIRGYDIYGRPTAVDVDWSSKAKSQAAQLGEQAAINAATNNIQQVRQPYEEELGRQRQEEWERQQREAKMAMVRSQLDKLHNSPNAGPAYNNAINQWIAMHGKEYKTEQELGNAIMEKFKMNDRGRTIDYPDDDEVLDLLKIRR